MLGTAKHYIGILLVFLLIGLGIITYSQYKSIKALETELSVAKINEKAFISEINTLEEDNLMFKFSVEQLNYFNDSLLTEMNKVRRELNIKDKNLKQLQYLLATAQKTDTIVFRDTLFIDRTLNIDTLIGDEWYNIRLGLQYPNLISTSPTFKSEKYIILNSKKETIDPPKKCFLGRWLQKKHEVVEVDIVEKNPYIEINQQRFIEIID